MQGFGAYFITEQQVTRLQIPLADGLQIKYLQAPKSDAMTSDAYITFMVIIWIID